MVDERADVDHDTRDTWQALHLSDTLVNNTRPQPEASMDCIAFILRLLWCMFVLCVCFKEEAEDVVNEGTKHYRLDRLDCKSRRGPILNHLCLSCDFLFFGWGE